MKLSKPDLVSDTTHTPNISVISSREWILDNWVFENFVSADELFPKALEVFEICVLVNNKLCRKLFSSLNHR